MSNDKSKYAATITGMYKQGREFVSLDLNDDVRKMILSAEDGSRITFNIVSPELKEQKGKTFPDAFLGIYTPEQVEEKRQDYLRWKASQGGSKPAARTAARKADPKEF